MKKRGFTLVELLAVIVILAIIALIAVPVFLGIINNSKKSSDKEGVNLYTDTVEKAIQKKQMSDPNFMPDKCDIKRDGNLECFSGTTSLGTVKVSMKGTKPTSGTIYITEDDITYENIVLNGKTYYEKEISNATLVNDAAPTGVSIGDEYTYRVNDTDTFNFYVLSIEGDKVNLIMDRNICEDGTVQTSDKQCTYAWHWQTQQLDDDDNNYGPDIAMTNLYKGTKNWKNVPDMIMSYVDENNNGNDYGYEGITTINGVTTIAGKQNKTSTSQRIGSVTEPLKARLPKLKEVTDLGCDEFSRESCLAWLVENMYSSYWLLSTKSGESRSAFGVSRYYSAIGGFSVSYAGENGLRPVITVPISDLN